MSQANQAAVASNENENTGEDRPRSSADVSRNVRKKYFVSTLLQGRLLARMLGYWFVYHVVLWHAMFLYRWMRHGGEMLAGGPARSFGDLYAEFFAHHYSLVVCALAILPLLLWDGIRTTHRVAGPIVRFRHAFAALTRGERIPPIKLREGDLMLELQDAFNEYLASLPAEPTPADEPLPPSDTVDDELLEQLVGTETVDEESESWSSDAADVPTREEPEPAGV